MTFRDEREQQSILGVSEAELCCLVTAFEQARLQRYQQAQHHYRQGGGRRGKLPTCRDKVQFCLYYLKHTPTYDLLGYEFGLSRSSAHEALRRHLQVLQLALIHLDVLPADEFARPEDLAAYLKKRG